MRPPAAATAPDPSRSTLVNRVRTHPVALLLLAAVTVLSGGCTPAPASAVAPRAHPVRCRDVNGLEGLLRPGAVLLLGELHGTAQGPAFVGDVVCAAARTGLPVTVGLELPSNEQAAFDRFVASAGGPADRAALLSIPFWAPEYPDGRSSEAMLELLERVRALRQAGSELRLVAFAAPASIPYRQHDRAMADTLAKAAPGAARGVMVAFAGNIHTRLTRGMPFDTTFAPMGYLLARRLPERRVVSLNMAHDGGDAWNCHPASDDPERFVCDARPFGAQDGPAAWSVELGEAGEDDGAYSGRYGVGPITASPPVRGSPAAP